MTRREPHAGDCPRSRKRPTSKAQNPSDSGAPIPARKGGKATRGSDRPCDGVQLVGGCVREAGHPGACRLGKPRPSGHDVYPDPAFLDAVGLGVAQYARIADGAASSALEAVPELVHDDPAAALYWGDNLATLVHLAGPEALGRVGDGVRLILSDPPYAPETHAGATTQRRGHTTGAVPFASSSAEQIRLTLEAALPLMHEDGGWAVFTCDWRHCAALLEDPPLGWRGVRFGIWNKLATGAPQFTGDRPATGWEAVCHLHTVHGEAMRWNGRGRDAVYSHRTVGAAAYPTEKPRALGAQILELFSDPGDLILDPWCGGAGWGRAALDHGRRWIGIDRAEAAIVVARKRLAQATLFQPPTQTEITP